MPYLTEHAAQQRAPDKRRYLRFRRQPVPNAPGASFIYGVPRTGAVEVQSVRFHALFWTPAQARAWLRKHGFDVSRFEEATAGAAPRKNPTVGVPPRDDLTRADYPGIFADFDADRVPTADDPDPLHPGLDTVEETRLADTMDLLLDKRQAVVAAKRRVLDALQGIAPPGAHVKGRVKSPYSMLGKLAQQHLGRLTDIAGTRVEVETGADARAVGQAVLDGATGADSIEVRDYYAEPMAGYRAFHFILYFGKTPVELQVKTRRMSAISDIGHHLYKVKRQDPEAMARITGLAALADEGDRTAAREVDALIADPARLQAALSRKE